MHVGRRDHGSLLRDGVYACFGCSGKKATANTTTNTTKSCAWLPPRFSVLHEWHLAGEPPSRRQLGGCPGCFVSETRPQESGGRPVPRHGPLSFLRDVRRAVAPFFPSAFYNCPSTQPRINHGCVKNGGAGRKQRGRHRPGKTPKGKPQGRCPVAATPARGDSGGRATDAGTKRRRRSHRSQRMPRDDDSPARFVDNGSSQKKINVCMYVTGVCHTPRTEFSKPDYCMKSAIPAQKDTSSDSSLRGLSNDVFAGTGAFLAVEYLAFAKQAQGGVCTVIDGIAPQSMWTWQLSTRSFPPRSCRDRHPFCSGVLGLWKSALGGGVMFIVRYGTLLDILCALLPPSRKTAASALPWCPALTAVQQPQRLILAFSYTEVSQSKSRSSGRQAFDVYLRHASEKRSKPWVLLTPSGPRTPNRNSGRARLLSEISFASRQLREKNSCRNCAGCRRVTGSTFRSSDGLP